MSPIQPRIRRPFKRWMAMSVLLAAGGFQGWAGVAAAADQAPATSPATPPIVSPADREALGQEALPPQASIPFPEHNIDDFRPNGRQGLWIRAQRQWYYAELFAPCDELPWAQHVGFGTDGAARFDRFSFIVVKGERCALRSLTKASPPPRPVKQPKPETARPASPR